MYALVVEEDVANAETTGAAVRQQSLNVVVDVEQDRAVYLKTPMVPLMLIFEYLY